MELARLFNLQRVRSAAPIDSTMYPEVMGIELEVENLQDYSVLIPGWTTHSDGSLRNGVEFVSNALCAAALDEAITNFYQSGIHFDSNERTSTHIHLNMTDTTVEVLQNVILIMYGIEEALFSMLGGGRKYAGYSMPLSEMPATRLAKLLGNHRDLVQTINCSRNVDRYYGLNTNVTKHGTVEFRYFTGGPTEQQLRKWIDLVVSVKRVAKQYSTTDLANKLTTVEGVADLLNELGYWGADLQEYSPLHAMHSYYQEVLPLLPSESITIPRSIITITPLTEALIKRAQLNNNAAGVAYLDEVLAISRVHALHDWYTILDNAVSLQGNYDFSAPGPSYDEPDDVDWEDDYEEDRDQEEPQGVFSTRQFYNEAELTASQLEVLARIRTQYTTPTQGDN